MKLAKGLWIIGIMLMMKSCVNGQPQEQDLIGTWKSDDGAKIEIKENFTFVAEQIAVSNLDFTTENQDLRVDFMGKWEITTDMYNKKVVKINSNKYTFNFYISGQGMLGDRKSTRLNSSHVRISYA